MLYPLLFLSFNYSSDSPSKLLQYPSLSIAFSLWHLNNLLWEWGSKECTCVCAQIIDASSPSAGTSLSLSFQLSVLLLGWKVASSITPRLALMKDEDSFVTSSAWVFCSTGLAAGMRGARDASRANSHKLILACFKLL